MSGLPTFFQKLFASYGSAPRIKESVTLPAQNGQSGKFLKTDGTNTSWGTAITEHQSLNGYATEAWVENQGYLTSASTLDAAKLSGTAAIDTTGNAATATTAMTATTATDYAAGGGIATALSGKQATISDLSDIRTGAALGATAQQPATTLAGYGITDASISGTEVTLGSNTVKALPSQSGMTNKFLMTNGTDASWETVNSLPEQSSSTSNKFLKSTGTVGAETWDSVETLPSQSGQNGKFLMTDGANTSWNTALTQHQDISGKINTSGSRGSLAGYQTSGSSTTIDASSADCNETGSSVAVSNGASGTSWTKIVRLTVAVSVSLGSSWSWEGGSAPTIKANGILVCCWCGNRGMAKFVSP